MKKNYYVTTSIPYVNGDPHIGFGMELVQADVLARAARQQGSNVLFSTGTDEHGTKIAEKAEESGKKVEEFVEEKSGEFRKLCELLNVSNDRFIRTTDKGHEQRSQLIWKALEKDIYKGKYKGLYDVRQEEFVPESQADPERLKEDHPQAYRRIEEDNYFFKLSSYTEQVKHAIESGSFQVYPKKRRNEILSVLNDGLQDISISRPTEKISWGIPVPGDKSQVMYVWFEALMNYITVLGYPEHDDFKTFWPANVQVIGKDIIRFHAAIWPAMLLSLGITLPKKLYVHGFINVDGKKMSKSIGNVVAPKDIVKKYGSDAFRYYFLKHISSSEDGDFSWEKFERAYNTELANELGNAVSRVCSMAVRFQEGVIGEIPPNKHDRHEYDHALENCQFDIALQETWEKIRGLNQYIDEVKPWVIAKEGDDEHLRDVLAQCISDLVEIGELIEPFLPKTSADISHIFAKGVVRPPKESLFPRKDFYTTQKPE
ncbi:MAG: methionine--tRNA ligase [bacterium]|nr:methionine--tRNA ligase [bacterium]